MASINKSDKRVVSERLAGGFGAKAARQDNEAELRRVVMSCLLWENLAYERGETNASRIKELVPTVDPQVVSEIAVSARFDQKLRHVPLLICREMARHNSHKHLVASTLEKVIHRPDEINEFLSIYWMDNGKKKTISSQVKKGLANSFKKFSEYQLSKWDKSKNVSLRDVMRLVRPTPKDKEQGELWGKLIRNSLPKVDTWEVGLSAAKNSDEKREVWKRLIEDNKLGSFAFLKNLRNMISVGVPQDVIRDGLSRMNKSMLLPIDFLKAHRYAPDFSTELENAMFQCVDQSFRIPGRTIFVVDISGSMGCSLSSRSEFTRMDAAAAMSVLAKEVCEACTIYATAGNDSTGRHATKKINDDLRGFELSNSIVNCEEIGRGGIFTRQCLEWIRRQESQDPDRIIIFSDSQDCDRGNKKPAPFGKKNYVCDISSHRHGINYHGVWTAEISGWSEAFLKFIACYELNS